MPTKSPTEVPIVLHPLFVPEELLVELAARQDEVLDLQTAAAYLKVTEKALLAGFLQIFRNGWLANVERGSDLILRLRLHGLDETEGFNPWGDFPILCTPCPFDAPDFHFDEFAFENGGRRHTAALL